MDRADAVQQPRVNIVPQVTPLPKHLRVNQHLRGIRSLVALVLKRDIRSLYLIHGSH
jgi:hypothetical protein